MTTGDEDEVITGVLEPSTKSVDTMSGTDAMSSNEELLNDTALEVA